MASSLHPHKGLRNHTPSTLTCSLSVAPSFFTCKKKTSRERPGRRQSHETLEEPPSPGPQRTFQNCNQKSRTGSGTRRKEMWGDWTSCPPGSPSSAGTFSSDLQALRNRPPTGIMKVKNLSFIFTCTLQKGKCQYSAPDSTCVCRVLSSNEGGKLLPGLETPQ